MHASFLQVRLLFFFNPSFLITAPGPLEGQAETLSARELKQIKMKMETRAVFRLMANQYSN